MAAGSLVPMFVIVYTKVLGENTEKIVGSRKRVKRRRHGRHIEPFM
jgi:hypothetical protein